MARLPDRPASSAREFSVLALTALACPWLLGVVAATVAAVAQPSFTSLEQSAVLLVPPEFPAQPAEELVPPFGAFDRAYRVDFVAPEEPETTVEVRAARLGWRPVASDEGTIGFRSDGMVATFEATGSVTVEVADGVRPVQAAAIAGAALLGAVLGPVFLRRRWRRQPRLVHSVPL